MSGYDSILEGVDKALVAQPTKEFLEELTEEQICACITWHYGQDLNLMHSEYIINESILKGHMLLMLKVLFEKLGGMEVY